LTAREHEAFAGRKFDSFAALDLDALFLHRLRHHRFRQLLVGIRRQRRE